MSSELGLGASPKERAPQLGARPPPQGMRMCFRRLSSSNRFAVRARRAPYNLDLCPSAAADSAID